MYIMIVIQGDFEKHDQTHFSFKNKLIRIPIFRILMYTKNYILKF